MMGPGFSTPIIWDQFVAGIITYGSGAGASCDWFSACRRDCSSVIATPTA